MEISLAACAYLLQLTRARRVAMLARARLARASWDEETDVAANWPDRPPAVHTVMTTAARKTGSME